MITTEPTRTSQGGAHGGEPRSAACPVWVRGRCDGHTCNCAAADQSGAGDDMTEKTCPACGGNAWDKHGNPCGTCGGNGTVRP